MYPECIARLKTITSAPSLMVLVLNPLPSRIKHDVTWKVKNFREKEKFY